MTKFLWTGESEFCICGHHLTDHETSQSLISIITQSHIVICKGGDKSRLIWSCHCDEFRPHRVVGEQEEVLENQNLHEEVIKE